MKCTGGYGKELSGELDTYGPVRQEKCWECFSDNKEVGQDELFLLKNELSASKEELEEIDDAIDELEDQRRDIKDDIYKCEKKIKALQDAKKVKPCQIKILSST